MLVTRWHFNKFLHFYYEEDYSRINGSNVFVCLFFFCLFVCLYVCVVVLFFVLFFKDLFVQFMSPLIRILLLWMTVDWQNQMKKMVIVRRMMMLMVVALLPNQVLSVVSSLLPFSMYNPNLSNGTIQYPDVQLNLVDHVNINHSNRDHMISTTSHPIQWKR